MTRYDNDPPSRQYCPCVRVTQNVTAYLETMTPLQFKVFFDVASNQPVTNGRRSYFKFMGPKGIVKVSYRSRTASTITLIRVVEDDAGVAASRSKRFPFGRATLSTVYYALGVAAALLAFTKWLLERWQ